MNQLKVYTGTWALKHQSPYILKPKMKNPKRAAFKETVGISKENVLQSFFVDDIPFAPTKAPTLKHLINEDKVTPAEKTDDGQNLRLSYLVCRQCSTEFVSKAHNRLYCDDCAALRKKIADSFSSKKRYGNRPKRKERNVLPTETCSDENIDNIHVGNMVTASGNLSMYSCTCKHCGMTFAASHHALMTNALQGCPHCFNSRYDCSGELLDEEVNDASSDDGISVFSRSFGFLQAKIKINNSLSLCNCGCGQRFVAQTAKLLNGTIKDCGCHYSELVDESVKSVKIGRKIGKITVISAMKIFEGDERATNRFFKCRCECGNDFIVKYNSLKECTASAKTITCGCELKTYTLKGSTTVKPPKSE